MKLTIVKGTGSNSAGTIYLNDHAINWPYDIQFKNASGTVMDYWREEYDATDMTVWVECDSIAASGDTNFYLYYGDSGVSDASDGDGTFIFFDGFTSVDAGKWDTTSGSPSIVDSTWIKFTSGGGASSGIRTKNAVVPQSSMCSIDMAIDFVTVSSDAQCGYSSGNYPTLAEPVANATKAGFAWYKEADYDRYVFKNGTGSFNSGSNKGIASDVQVRNSWVITADTQKHICAGDRNINDTFSGTSGLGSSALKINLGGPHPSFSNDVRIDWILVRKITTNEPAWASPGSEESAGIDSDSLLFFPRKYRGPDDLSFLELS
jgi:hypothetical protein